MNWWILRRLIDALQLGFCLTNNGHLRFMNDLQIILLLLLLTWSLQKYPNPTIPATAKNKQIMMTDRSRLLDLVSIFLISYTPSVKCNPKTLSTCTETLLCITLSLGSLWSFFFFVALLSLLAHPPPVSRNPFAKAVIVRNVPHHKEMDEAAVQGVGCCCRESGEVECWPGGGWINYRRE